MNDTEDAQSVIEVLDLISCMTHDEHKCSEFIDASTYTLLTSLGFHGLKCDKVSDKDLSKKSLQVLVNLSCHETCVSKLLESGSSEGFMLFWKFFNGCLSCNNEVLVDLAASFLLNLSRVIPEKCVLNEIQENKSLQELIKIGLKFKRSDSALSYVNCIQLLRNLTQESKISKIVVDHLLSHNDFFNLYSNESSEDWKLGFLGVLQNACLNSRDNNSSSSFMYTNEDVLSVILLPLLTEKAFSDPSESVKFPKNLSTIKVSVETNAGIRETAVSIAYFLCASREGREAFRQFSVYYILRAYSELDLIDSEEDVCLNLINLLIQTEDEIGCKDLIKLEIPSDIQEKFNSLKK